MATRSIISMQLEDKLFKSVYCHWDGGLDWNGKILFEHYQDVEKIKELIQLGDISSLYQDVHIPESVEHSFDKRCEGITTFYGRDRGEKNIEAKTHYSINGLTNRINKCGAEFLYLYKDSKWFYCTDRNKELKELIF